MIVAEKSTIRKNGDCLELDGDLSLLSKVNHIIIKNEQEELAYNILERNLKENSMKFFINKQAAYNNNFHMIDEDMSPLSDIEVEIVSDNPEEVIRWITS